MSRKPNELILLRRFAALPNERDQLEFMAACMNVVSGESVDSAYHVVCARRQRLATMNRKAAKAEARRVAQMAQPAPAAGGLVEDLRALLADVILSEPLVLDPDGNGCRYSGPGGPAPRPVPDDTGDAA